MVRYDAFGDMGGRLSFSCAVVDDGGDGLVLSAIHARGESRTYAKGIVGGASVVTLSEGQLALGSSRRGAWRCRTPPGLSDHGAMYGGGCAGDWQPVRGYVGRLLLLVRFNQLKVHIWWCTLPLGQGRNVSTGQGPAPLGRMRGNG